MTDPRADILLSDYVKLTAERDALKADLADAVAAEKTARNLRRIAFEKSSEAIAERDALKAKTSELDADLKFMTDNRNKWQDATTLARRERDALRADLAKAVEALGPLLEFIGRYGCHWEAGGVCEHPQTTVERARAYLASMTERQT